MIEFKFKTKDKTISAVVPESWKEVTLSNVLSLNNVDANDMIGVLAALTGQKFTDLQNSKSNSLWEPLFGVLSYILKAPKWEKVKRPERVYLKDKYITPPKKVELQAFGQKVLAMQVISEEKPGFEKIADILAIYLQPAYDGVLDADRIKELKKHVLNMKAFDAMPYGIFFFNKLLKRKSFGRLGLKASPRIMRLAVSISRQAEIISSNSMTSLP